MREKEVLEVIDQMYVDEERPAVNISEVRERASMSGSEFAQAVLSLRGSGDLATDETGLITSAEYSHLYKPNG